MGAPAGEYRETLGRPGDAATVYVAGTTTLAALYTDVNETTAAPNPSNLDSLGALLFFADVGAYDVLVNGARLRVEVSPHPGTYGTVLPAVGSFTYDASGNPLTDPDGNTYTWNADGTIATQTKGGVTRTFSYDGSGNLTGVA